VSRAAIYTALKSDPTLESLAPGYGCYPNNSVDTPPEDQFLILRWLDKTPGPVKGRGPVSLQVWAHDHSGSYTVIDQMLKRVSDILLAMVQVDGGDGHTVTCVDWTGESQDLYDDGFRTITRNAAFTVVSRPT
jgi:hypothetical protein